MTSIDTAIKTTEVFQPCMECAYIVTPIIIVISVLISIWLYRKGIFK